MLGRGMKTERTAGVSFYYNLRTSPKKYGK